MVTAILVIIGILCLVELFFQIVFSGYWATILIGLGLIILIEILIIIPVGKARLSVIQKARKKAMEKKENEEFDSKMADYNEKLRKYNEDIEAQKKANEEYYGNRIEAAKQELEKANAEHRKAIDEYDKDDTLSAEDADDETIDELIRLIRTKRANSITEGLNLIDAQRERDKRVEAEQKRAEEERKRQEALIWSQNFQRRLEEDKLRSKMEYEQASRDLETTLHRREIEKTLNEIKDSLK